MREILKMTALRRIAPAMPGRRLIHANAPRDIIKRYVRYLNILAATVSGASIFVMVLVVAIDVVGRYVFNRPLRGGQELVEVTLVVAVLLSLGYTSMRERHVRMDLVVSRLGSRGRAIVGVSVSGFALVR